MCDPELTLFSLEASKAMEQPAGVSSALPTTLQRAFGTNDPERYPIDEDQHEEQK